MFASLADECSPATVREMATQHLKYLVLIEGRGSSNNYSAYSPDVPGCVATGATRAECLREMKQALTLHIEGLRADALPIPEPCTSAELVTV
jgi:predicted RNase H-like HicB family nuclease